MTSSATLAKVALIFEILEERTIGRRGHCYFDPTFAESLAPIGEHESDMLDFTASPRRPESRLSCQVRIADALDGMTVHIPAVQ